jgi:hypothetical protein
MKTKICLYTTVYDKYLIIIWINKNKIERVKFKLKYRYIYDWNMDFLCER